VRQDEEEASEEDHPLFSWGRGGAAVFNLRHWLPLILVSAHLCDMSQVHLGAFVNSFRGQALNLAMPDGVGDEVSEDNEEVAVYCPECAAQEFGGQ
jgi:hypothetical protein